jgi:hypothetical protein
MRQAWASGLRTGAQFIHPGTSERVDGIYTDVWYTHDRARRVVPVLYDHTDSKTGRASLPQPPPVGPHWYIYLFCVHNIICSIYMYCVISLYVEYIYIYIYVYILPIYTSIYYLYCGIYIYVRLRTIYMYVYVHGVHVHVYVCIF